MKVLLSSTHRSFLPFNPVPENGGSEGLGWSPRLPDSNTNNFQHNKILWTYLLNININHRHYVTFTLNWTPVLILQPYEATALGWRATALSFRGHHGQGEAAVPPPQGPAPHTCTSVPCRFGRLRSGADNPSLVRNPAEGAHPGSSAENTGGRAIFTDWGDPCPRSGV